MTCYGPGAASQLIIVAHVKPSVTFAEANRFFNKGPNRVYIVAFSRKIFGRIHMYICMYVLQFVDQKCAQFPQLVVCSAYLLLTGAQ